MKIKLVFEDWRDPTGKNIYSTEEGIRLSAGDFHSGSTFTGTIDLDIEQEEDLRRGLRVVPVFRLYLP